MGRHIGLQDVHLIVEYEVREAVPVLVRRDTERGRQVALADAGGPSSSTLAPSAMKRPVASSLTFLGSIDGWKLQSKTCSDFERESGPC